MNGNTDPDELTLAFSLSAFEKLEDPNAVFEDAANWSRSIGLVDDDTERSKREVEAEAVAYVVGRYCGLDTSGSAFYLAAWESDDPEVVRERLGRISRTAEELIDVLEE